MDLILQSEVNTVKTCLKPEAMLFPTPVLIVGTYNEDGTPNAMNVAWGGLCSSTPPCIMIAVRKERRTLENIMSRNAFTVNLPSEKYVKEADYFGMISGKKAQKLDAAGLTAVRGREADAPVIEEFPFSLECTLENTMQAGSHVMVIGRIVAMSAAEECLTENGTPDIHKLKPLVYNPAENTYCGIGEDVEKAFSAGMQLLKGSK